MSAELYTRTVERRRYAPLGAAYPRADLAHAMRQLITTLGLTQLSGALLLYPPALSDGAFALAERLALGHAQLLAVHAAEVTVRAVALAVAPLDLELAHANVHHQALALGRLEVDPRAQLTGRLRALLGPEHRPEVHTQPPQPEDTTREVRGLCAGVAILAARIGLSLDTPRQPEISADSRRVATTRPAPPCIEGEERGDAP